MNILKFARKTVLKIKRASLQNYKALLLAYEKAQAASIDPYDDVSQDELKKIKDVARSVAIVTNKAYRTGVEGKEIKYFMDKVKSQTGALLASTKSSVFKKDLNELISALRNVQSIDIPAQISGAGSASEVKMKQDSITAVPPQETETDDEIESGLTYQMEDVVDRLVHKNDPYKDISGRPYGDKWYTPK